MRNHTTARILIPSLALALALAGCGGDDDSKTAASDESPSSAGTPASTTAEAATSTAVATSTGPTSETTGSESSAGVDLADGRHPAYATGIDVAARTLTFDVIQFLTGADAAAAYHAANPTDLDGLIGDYYILDENPRLRTAPVANDVSVMLVRLAEDSSADSTPGTFEELPAYFAATGPGQGAAISASPYWITIESGVITGIEEQYLP